MTDSLIHNARIRTMDPTAPLAEWLLIRADKVAALGSGTPPDAATKIDAGGRLVLPGFQDAHIHLLSGGIDIATAAFLYDAMSEGELLDTLRAHAAAKPHMPIVFGSGWQAGVFGDHNLTAAVLDRAVSDRPVLIYDSSFHNACLNSRALQMAGVQDMADPPNGHIVRDAQGRGTGMLHEEVKFDRRGVTSLDWNSYPVARFSDCPEITPIVVQRLDQPSSGAGEEVMAAGAAAIANAFFDATSKRMRTFPFTPERVLAALQA